MSDQLRNCRCLCSCNNPTRLFAAGKNITQRNNKMDTFSACRPLQAVKGLVQTNYNRKIPTAFPRHTPLTARRQHGIIISSHESGSCNSLLETQGHSSRHRDQNPSTVCQAAGALAGMSATDSTTAATAAGEQLIRNWLGVGNDAKLETRKVRNQQ